MTIISPTLNVPQSRFLALPHKFKAFVAGFGCVKEDTLVATPQGLRPISELYFGDEVVSFDAKNLQFQLSPTSGGFPKGKANLYRVITTRGEFVASGHHRVLVGRNNYQSVERLSVGQRLSTSSDSRLLTTLGLGRIWSPEDDLYYWETVLNCLGGCEGESRQYGQQPLLSLDGVLSCSPLRDDARIFLQRFYCQGFAPRDVRLEPLQEHIRQGLYGVHGRKNRSLPPSGLLAVASEDRDFSLFLERIFGKLRLFRQSLWNKLCRLQVPLSDEQFHIFLENALWCSLQNPSPYEPLAVQAGGSVLELGMLGLQRFQKFLLRFFSRQSTRQFFESILLFSCAYPSPVGDSDCSTSDTKILSIERQPVKEWYWDIHVAGNNNYVSADGAIHHNSGKTWVGCADLAKHFYEFPRVNAGYFAPTYTQIRDIFYPTIEEALVDWGLTAKVCVGNKEVDLYRGRVYMGTIICRSMDDPGTLVGFKIGKALVDEIDLMQKDKAQTVWRKIIARLRYNVPGLQNGIDVTTTPEGFRFVFDQFDKQPRENPKLRERYGMIQASTYDNEINLPDDYIPSLLDSYPGPLIDAYIHGKFTNLQTGTIYSAYSKKDNICTDTINDQDTVLYIGMDFNVGHMAAVAHVKRNNLPRAVDEIVNAYDTPDMIRRIKERYWRFDGNQYQRTRQIRIYPDSSGDSRKSVNASETDIALLRQAGFTVCAPAANPPVKDRINSMNAMFCNAAGERRYLVNPEKCPSYSEALDQQAWAANGEPDKTTGHDHVNDASGYYIRFDYPINKRTFTAQRPTGGF